MTTDLNQDQKIALKKLFENQEYSRFEKEVEKLGKLENLPIYLLMGYAGSKVINPNSKKKDFLKSTIIFEKIYSKDKSNNEALNNLIISSLKAETTTYVMSYLIEKYESEKENLKIIEGLARCHFLLGNMDLSVKFFKRLIELNPVELIDGGRLTYLASINYLSEFGQKDYFKECKELDNQFNQYFKFSKYKDNRAKKDKIKIGFFSSDFKSHSVNLFLKDVISKINKKEFFLTALSNLNKSFYDKETDFYKNHFDEWYDIFNYKDEQLIEFIRSKNLDIIIDLNGFTFGNRINIFAARVAKTQILWLGYNNSLGIKNMDYFIVDKNLIKKEEEKLYSEKILYLPKIWNSMSKPNILPQINNLPFQTHKKFKYGSFNSFKKISNKTIEVWSKILNQTESELYLKNSEGYNKEIYSNLLKKFKNQNVDLKKIIFLDRSSKDEFLKDYNKIDLALDTFPYNGVTTTFQSYLMGVPVLTMKGFNANSRCGESININLNLKEFIATSEKDYIKKALLYRNKKKLSTLRSSLRNKVLKSSLFNTGELTKDLTKILRNLVKII